MKIAFAGFEKREKADLLIVPFWEGACEAASFSELKRHYAPLLTSGDFKGKRGEVALLYMEGQAEPRLLLLGLGKKEEQQAEDLRQSYAAAFSVALSKRIKSLNLLSPENFPREEGLRAVGASLFLSNYTFSQLKRESIQESPPVLLERVNWVDLDAKELALLEREQTIAEGVYLARDLVNGNADDVTPEMLGATARGFEKISPKVKTTLFDKRWLEKEKMGLLLAVNRGSEREPFLIQVSYQGNPGSEEQIVFVGKGVTYDTGGLNLKGETHMLTMKCDMAGSAAVLGAVRTAAALDLKVNLTVLVPATENGIDANSYKPGDVYVSYSGKTVEINNTDAEGRLVLADAISYAVRNLKPTYLVDLATLTGGVVIALGDEIAGLFANDEELAQRLLAASKRSGELLWKMPLYEGYADCLKSDIADLTNLGGREASSMKGALFLREFVGKATKWAHIDIAGTAYWTKPKHYHPTHATGFGVRLLIDFLENR